MLFTLAPVTRELFPINMETQHTRLVRAIVHVVQMVDRPDDLAPFLRQLGRDHRKFGVLEEHYEAVGTALLAALKKYLGEDWTTEVEHAWAEAYSIIARSMQEAALEDQAPAYWLATVTDYRRFTWDLAAVRLQPHSPLSFNAGQYMSVEIPQRPRLWRYMSPANAPAEDGALEFHVQAVEGGWVSRAMVGHTKPGDVWRIGPPLGRLTVDRLNGREVLMIAGGTGVAPMQSMLNELAQWGTNPPVRLFYGARSEKDLYNLAYLRELASTNPWLSVTAVAEHGALSPEVERGTLNEVLTRHGSWQNHDILVAGSPAMIRATVSQLLSSGATLGQIKYDPFTID
jgi:NAD(P)H-flavin reductase